MYNFMNESLIYHFMMSIKFKHECEPVAYLFMFQNFVKTNQNSYYIE